MPIQYKVASKKRPDKKGKMVVGYCAVPTKRRMVGFRDLAKEIAIRTTFSSGDMYGALEALQEVILDYIQDGHSVRLGDLGIFSASISAEVKDTPKEVNIKSIREARLVFRTSVFVKKQMHLCKFVRASKD